MDVHAVHDEPAGPAVGLEYTLDVLCVRGADDCRASGELCESGVWTCEVWEM